MLFDGHNVVHCLSLNQDASLLVSGGLDGTIMCWHTNTDQMLWKYIGDPDKSIRWLIVADSAIFFQTSRDYRNISKMDLMTGELLANLESGMDAVSSVLWFRGSSKLY